MGWTHLLWWITLYILRILFRFVRLYYYAIALFVLNGMKQSGFASVGRSGFFLMNSQKVRTTGRGGENVTLYSRGGRMHAAAAAAANNDDDDFNKTGWPRGGGGGVGRSFLQSVNGPRSGCPHRCRRRRRCRRHFRPVVSNVHGRVLQLIILGRENRTDLFRGDEKKVVFLGKFSSPAKTVARTFSIHTNIILL